MRLMNWREYQKAHRSPTVPQRSPTVPNGPQGPSQRTPDSHPSFPAGQEGDIALHLPYDKRVHLSAGTAAGTFGRDSGDYEYGLGSRIHRRIRGHGGTSSRGGRQDAIDRSDWLARGRGSNGRISDLRSDVKGSRHGSNARATRCGKAVNRFGDSMAWDSARVCLLLMVETRPGDKQFYDRLVKRRGQSLRRASRKRTTKKVNMGKAADKSAGGGRRKLQRLARKMSPEGRARNRERQRRRCSPSLPTAGELRHARELTSGHAWETMECGQDEISKLANVAPTCLSALSVGTSRRWGGGVGGGGVKT
jgi:hypothetical protein